MARRTRNLFHEHTLPIAFPRHGKPPQRIQTPAQRLAGRYGLLDYRMRIHP